MKIKTIGYATHATRRSGGFQQYATLAEFKAAHPRRKYVWLVGVEQFGSYRMVSQRKLVADVTEGN